MALGRRRTPPPVLPAARIVLVSRAGCHLCEQVRAVLERVSAEVGAELAEVSVDEDSELLRRYGEQVPVTFVDGRLHDYWRVDEERLRAALFRA